MHGESRNIYCISGLGADEKVFNQLHINGYELRYLPYLSPLKNESLEAYAARMFQQIPEPGPMLLGLSFGGMVAIEMAKQFPVSMVILVSAVKTYRELPLWMRWSGRLSLHKIMPLKSNRLTRKTDDRRMGIQNENDRAMVEAYRRTADRGQVNWAIDKILTWKNTRMPARTYHIHGSHDRMFPLKNLLATHVIEGGTHIMILNKGAEISACIEKIVSNQ